MNIGALPTSIDSDKKATRSLIKARVLVACPHADRKNHVIEQWIETAKTLTWPDYDIFIADNSDSSKNKKRLVKAGVNCVHIDPKGKSNIRYICDSHEAIRRHAIRCGYDYILHLEDDITPPADIIERLIAHRKRVVSALYFVNFGEDSHLVVQEIEDGAGGRETIRLDDGHDINFVDGKLKQVYACGLGCILIHRSVFEKIAFRYEEGVFAHPDSFFAVDLHKSEIPQYVDTSIIVRHDNSHWVHF